MAHVGRPPLIAREERLTVVDPSPEREALPPGHVLTWSMLAQLTPSIEPSWPERHPA